MRMRGLRLLHRAQAAGADRNSLRVATDGDLNLADIGLPTSVGLTIGVRNVLSENNALTANTTFCHSLHLPNAQLVQI